MCERGVLAHILATRAHFCFDHWPRAHFCFDHSLGPMWHVEHVPALAAIFCTVQGSITMSLGELGDNGCETQRCFACFCIHFLQYACQASVFAICLFLTCFVYLFVSLSLFPTLVWLFDLGVVSSSGVCMMQHVVVNPNSYMVASFTTEMDHDKQSVHSTQWGLPAVPSCVWMLVCDAVHAECCQDCCSSMCLLFHMLEPFGLVAVTVLLCAGDFAWTTRFARHCLGKWPFREAHGSESCGVKNP